MIETFLSDFSSEFPSFWILLSYISYLGIIFILGFRIIVHMTAGSTIILVAVFHDQASSKKDVNMKVNHEEVPWQEMTCEQ